MLLNGNWITTKPYLRFKWENFLITRLAERWQINFQELRKLSTCGIASVISQETFGLFYLICFQVETLRRRRQSFHPIPLVLRPFCNCTKVRTSCSNSNKADWKSEDRIKGKSFLIRNARPSKQKLNLKFKSEWLESRRSDDWVSLCRLLAVAPPRPSTKLFRLKWNYLIKFFHCSAIKPSFRFVTLFRRN